MVKHHSNCSQHARPAGSQTAPFVATLAPWLQMPNAAGQKSLGNTLAAQGTNMNTPTDTLYTLLRSNVTVPLLSAAGNVAAAQARCCSNSSTSTAHCAQARIKHRRRRQQHLCPPPHNAAGCVTLLPPACRNLLRPQHSCIREHLCVLHQHPPTLPAAACCMPAVSRQPSGSRRRCCRSQTHRLTACAYAGGRLPWC